MPYSLGDMVLTPQGVGIVFDLLGAPEGGNRYVVLLKQRDEITGFPTYWQFSETDLQSGPAHPVYGVGQRFAIRGLGAVISAIDGDTLTLRFDQPPDSVTCVERDSQAVMPFWRLTLIDQFQ